MPVAELLFTHLFTHRSSFTDDVMKSYVEAVAKANLLASQNITSDTEFITIERLETIDPEEPVVAVDLATTVTDGVEELSCSITTG